MATRRGVWETLYPRAQPGGANNLNPGLPRSSPGGDDPTNRDWNAGPAGGEGTDLSLLPELCGWGEGRKSRGPGRSSSANF